MVDFEKWTPLMTAIRRNYPKIVAKLLRDLVGQAPKDVQSAIDTPGLDGITPIMLICGGTLLDDGAGNSLTASDIITELLKLGPDINGIDLEENTVLHHAMNAAVPRDENLIKGLIQLMRPKRILQSNIRGETAFDSCFDKDKDCPFSESKGLVQFLIELFARDQTLQQAEEPLCWTVYRLERHTTALALFSKLKQAGKIQGNFDPHGCSLVEWAIHARLPRVLLTYLRAVGLNKKGDKDSQVGEDRERGLNLVRSRDSSFTATAEWQAEQKSSDQSRDGDPDLKDLKDLEDILDYLYPEKTERRASPWALSEQTGPMQATSQRFRAAIIQNNFFKFRNVYEILYDSDQMENVRQTVERLQKFEYNPNPHKQASPHVFGANFRVGPDFTWIHLPASNDAAKKILKQKKVASFLRSSWIEIPDRTSMSRFMRPRYVVKDKGFPTNLEVRHIARDIGDQDIGRAWSQANEEHQHGTGLFSPVDDRNMASLDRGSVGEASKGEGKVPRVSFIAPPSESMMIDQQSDGQKEETIGASAIYMPYLYFSTYHESEGDRSSRPKTDTTSPDKRLVLEQIDLRQSLFAAYKDSVIHQPATLDEFYYHFASDNDSREDRDLRNKDQVITKYLKAGDKRKLKYWPVLRHLQKQVRNGSRRIGPSSATEMSKVIVNYCVGAYERKRKRKVTTNGSVSIQANSQQNGLPKEERSIRQIFSDSINEIRRKESTLFNQAYGHPHLSSNRKDSKNKDQSTEKTASDLSSTLGKVTRQLCDIKDIRDELNILKTNRCYLST
ncbi:hypothetical protein GCG54_00002759 [Colletotrichum gloeosporioides]|uniref:Ankyrin repeat protein n=1 Tax=Colletotrichum gloeosporioides TaxID=474922 RepID=A0A8H4CUW9_COLGL|nr:uncharacterized protein GCG54_00002759 [Colletotrichum gloeosporioides]KAF3810301.1 hypothetical protein GCG54_00002759 [Colletotrichum gloeosporioides]